MCICNKEKHDSIVQEINATKESTNSVKEVKVNENSDIVLGKHIDGEITSISNIIGDMKNVILEAYVFGIDTMERESINIISLKISD